MPVLQVMRGREAGFAALGVYERGRYGFAAGLQQQVPVI